MEQISADLLSQENSKVIPEHIFQSRRSLPVFQVKKRKKANLKNINFAASR